MNESREKAKKILMFFALRQTFRREEVSWQLLQLLKAVQSGDQNAIAATIEELGPVYEAVCFDVEQQP